MRHKHKRPPRLWFQSLTKTSGLLLPALFYMIKCLKGVFFHQTGRIKVIFDKVRFHLKIYYKDARISWEWSNRRMASRHRAIRTISFFQNWQKIKSIKLIAAVSEIRVVHSGTEVRALKRVVRVIRSKIRFLTRPYLLAALTRITFQVCL